MAKKSQNKTFIIAIVFLCSFLLFCLLLLYGYLKNYILEQRDEDNYQAFYNKALDYKDSDFSPSLYAEEYASWIRGVGAHNALELLKESLINDFELVDRHNQAHYFGEALFLEKGKGGIIFCDYSFNYACQHGLLGSLIQKEGVASLKKLSASCYYGDTFADDIAACMHGVGHGLVAYFGYTKTGLNASLKVCEDAFDHYIYEGLVKAKSCHSGAFMEYNFRVMLDWGKDRLRPIEEDLYYPCLYLNIDDRANEACWYNLSFWWINSFNYQDHEEGFVKAISLCKNIPGEMNIWQAYCAKGVGIRAGFRIIDEDELSPKEPQYLYDICSLFPSKHSEFECVLEGFIWFAQYEIPIEQTVRWCDFHAPSDSKEKCLDRVSLLYNYYDKQDA